MDNYIGRQMWRFIFLIAAALGSTCGLRRHAFVRMSALQAPVIIVGAGPTGLTAAIMLARRGYQNVKVFDRLDEPLAPDSSDWVDFTKERSYNIGLSGRGQRVLRELDVLTAIESVACDVVGRKDWSPESEVDKPREIIYTGTKSYTTRVIQRDRLSSVLLNELRTNPDYSKVVTVQFNTQCNSVKFTDKSALVHITDRANVGELVLESSFVLGCDGTASALRDAMETASGGSLRVKRYEDKNVRVYRTIPLHFPPNNKKDWNSELNYSARTKSDINIDALPCKNGPMLGVVLYRPWDKRITELKSKDDARAFFREFLPMFNDVVKDDDLERFSRKECSKLPRFSFTGPRLDHGNCACLLGDAIHTVKPYFGLGANSAFEDVSALNECLEKSKDDVPTALRDYSARRGKEARALVEISQRLDGGFLAFVLPLLVDTWCNSKAPWLFAPSMLRILQDEKLSFSFIQLRKRMDRAMQAAMSLGLGLAVTRVFGAVLNLGGKLFTRGLA